MEKALLSSVSKTDKEGKKVTYNVEEIENGFLLSQSEEWKDKKGNWQYKNTKKFYTENPLDEKAIKINAVKKVLGKDEEDMGKEQYE